MISASAMHLLPYLGDWQWIAAPVAGVLAVLVTTPITNRALKTCGDERPLGTGAKLALFAATTLYVLLAVEARSLDVPAVRPTQLMFEVRLVFHITLIIALFACTMTDLRTYYIPDRVALGGLLIGVAAATLTGDLQLMHVWIDWNQEIPQIRGPYIPAWIAAHPHWHGLAWSSAGAIVGGGLVAIVRRLGTGVLGREALGTGDITLMAMAGAFLGWQPVVMAFLFAPLFAVIVGLPVNWLSGKTYLPFGPWLALGCYLVLCTWRRQWMFETGDVGVSATSFATRRLLGDSVALAILAVIAIGGLTLLLGLLRAYKQIPIERRGPVDR